ncbi:MAG: tRNA 2-selenouridine(34) synthase MnmH [Desulfuromonadales bacterium]|jgi:tRNA 2-selenouridine synthase|nr:tRNA 2-selenouridine(34) synthase MnmH [Desulfuromonadales bacterium]
MSITISLEHALAMRDKGALLVDARSPGEFAEATIPGAINVPVLDDAERAEVGTLYKQVGKRQARQRGVELVAPKIPAMIAQVAKRQAETSQPVVVFCWRGGMRSLALTQFLELAGIPARQLSGGHKGFRRHVLDFFEHGRWAKLLVFRGLTGVGKTHYLHRLAEQGYPVVDLEGLANHRGSAFGNLGLPSQPSQQTFEALLWDELRKIPCDGYILTEGESRHIGRVALPTRFYQALQVETSIWIHASLQARVRNILADYPAVDRLKEEFTLPIRALKDKLGKETMYRYLELLDAGNWAELVSELMVNYYDPLYRHTLPERRVEVDAEPEGTVIERILSAVAEVLAPSTSPQ